MLHPQHGKAGEHTAAASLQ